MSHLQGKSSDGEYARPPAFNPAINLQPSAPLLQPSSSGGEAAAFLNDVPPPPSYEEAVAAPVAPPTSYKFGPAGILDIWGKLSNTVIYTTSLLGMLGIMSGMIALGGAFLPECPAEPKLPLMLIIGGVLILISLVVNVIDRRIAMKNNGGNPVEEHNKSILNKFLAFVFLIWLVTISYWVYTAYKPSFDYKDLGYCNGLLYWFSFWLLNATYAIMVIVCLCQWQGKCR